VNKELNTLSRLFGIGLRVAELVMAGLSSNRFVLGAMCVELQPWLWTCSTSL